MIALLGSRRGRAADPSACAVRRRDAGRERRGEGMIDDPSSCSASAHPPLYSWMQRRGAGDDAERHRGTGRRLLVRVALPAGRRSPAARRDDDDNDDDDNDDGRWATGDETVLALLGLRRGRAAGGSGLAARSLAALAEEGQWRSLRLARFGVGPQTYRLALHVKGDGATCDDDGDGATGNDDGEGAMGDGRRSRPRFARLASRTGRWRVGSRCALSGGGRGGAAVIALLGSARVRVGPLTRRLALCDGAMRGGRGEGRG